MLASVYQSLIESGECRDRCHHRATFMKFRPRADDVEDLLHRGILVLHPAKLVRGGER